MKKNILWIIFLLFSMCAYTQNYYTKISLGYGIPLGGRELTKAEGDTNHYEQKIRGRLSAGKGLLFNLGVGKMYNDYLGLELNAAGVLFNKNIDRIDIYTQSYQKLECYNNINITPTFKIAVPFKNQGILKNSQLFARFGLVIPIINNGYIEYTEKIGAGEVYKKEKIINFFDPGFFAAVGLSVNLTPQISIFMEISGQNMNNKIKSSEIEVYTINGENALNELTTSEKQVNYHRKRIKETDNIDGHIDSGKPTDRLTTITPAHNIGINGGIIIKLFKNGK